VIMIKAVKCRNGRDWLTRTPDGSSRQWIQFVAPAHELEELLHTSFHAFEHVETGVLNIACSQSVSPLQGC
jgi:hypothetical protein